MENNDNNNNNDGGYLNNDDVEKYKNITDRAVNKVEAIYKYNPFIHSSIGEDLHQEAWLRIAINWKNKPESMETEAWVYRQAYYGSLDFLRKYFTNISRLSTREITDRYLDISSRQDSSKLLMGDILKHNNKLSRMDKKIILLLLYGLTQKEIGTILKIKRGLLNKKVQKIRGVLWKFLDLDN